MEKSKKMKIAQIFAFLAMGFSLLSVPFHFFGTYAFTAPGVEIDRLTLLTVFQLSSADEAVKGTFVLLGVLMICAVAFAVLTAVFCIFKVKALKITGFAASVMALGVSVASMLVVLLSVKKIEWIEALTLSYGEIMILVSLVIAFVFALLSMVFFLKAQEKVQTADGFVPYDVPADIVGGVDDTVLFSGNNYTNATGKGNVSIVSGSCEGFSIPVLPGDMIVIGKDPRQCSVVIDREYTNVSRRHCEISFDVAENIYLVRDCSANGTYIDNGTRLAQGVQQKLPRGTMLTLAKSNNIIRLD